ncbi:MAG TPA: cupredoxin domain-containing protein [Mycobacteriales bacterium]|nr:cupredoxin domain-containing protein [Mycobacteriales bacterium]
MRPSLACRPVVCVLLTALVAACSGSPGQPAASAPSGAGTPTPPAAGPALPSGPGDGPAVPSTTPPFAQVTPGVTTTGADGVQQVLIDGFNDTFQPGVFHMHPGRIRVILRNDDPVDVHNLIFSKDGGARTPDVPPGKADSVTVVLTKPGLYDFICSFHELVGMRGQVKVE